MGGCFEDGSRGRLSPERACLGVLRVRTRGVTATTGARERFCEEDARADTDVAGRTFDERGVGLQDVACLLPRLALGVGRRDGEEEVRDLAGVARPERADERVRVVLGLPVLAERQPDERRVRERLARRGGPRLHARALLRERRGLVELGEVASRHGGFAWIRGRLRRGRRLVRGPSAAGRERREQRRDEHEVEAPSRPSDRQRTPAASSQHKYVRPRRPTEDQNALAALLVEAPGIL
jgi:hypothetical protein